MSECRLCKSPSIKTKRRPDALRAAENIFEFFLLPHLNSSRRKRRGIKKKHFFLFIQKHDGCFVLALFILRRFSLMKKKCVRYLQPLRHSFSFQRRKSFSCLEGSLCTLLFSHFRCLVWCVFSFFHVSECLSRKFLVCLHLKLAPIV